jgi:copper oxidase (laccase) domain-containing protein
LESFVKQDVENSTAFKPHGERWWADLYGLARLALARAGVVQVSGGQYCTFTEQDKYFSFRRDGETGRMATVIWLEGKQR